MNRDVYQARNYDEFGERNNYEPAWGDDFTPRGWAVAIAALFALFVIGLVACWAFWVMVVPA